MLAEAAQVDGDGDAAGTDAEEADVVVVLLLPILLAKLCGVTTGRILTEDAVTDCPGAGG